MTVDPVFAIHQNSNIAEMMHYAGQLQDEMIEYRRDMHAHPELLYDVVRTSNKVVELLEEWGITVRRNVGKHFGMGVVGLLQGLADNGNSEPTLLLRADMDALANRIDPQEAAVLAFGTLQAGTAVNVIAEHSELTGTFRAFTKTTVAAIINGLQRHAAAITESYGGKYKLELCEGIAVVNNTEAVQQVLHAARAVLGEDQVILLEQPSLAGEDFGWYLDKVPGAFAFIGCGNKEKGIVHAIHHPQFNIDEAMLGHGASILVRLAIPHNGSAGGKERKRYPTRVPFTFV